jgi:hypothetical protein
MTTLAIDPADRLTIAVAEAARSGRAMPLAPADMAQARPDLWATAKAAERFLAARSGDGGLGGFNTLIRARYRKGLRGRWSRALVPIDGGRAALEAIIGPVVAYEVDGADAAEAPAGFPHDRQPAFPAFQRSEVEASVRLQRAQLAALAQRLDAVRPKRTWGIRQIDGRRGRPRRERRRPCRERTG